MPTWTSQAFGGRRGGGSDKTGWHESARIFAQECDGGGRRCGRRKDGFVLRAHSWCKRPDFSGTHRYRHTRQRVGWNGGGTEDEKERRDDRSLRLVVGKSRSGRCGEPEVLRASAARGPAHGRSADIK